MVADVANAKDGDWGERDDRYVDRHGTLYHLYGVIEFPQWAAVIEGVHHCMAVGVEAQPQSKAKILCEELWQSQPPLRSLVLRESHVKIAHWASGSILYLFFLIAWTLGTGL